MPALSLTETICLGLTITSHGFGLKSSTKFVKFTNQWTRSWLIRVRSRHIVSVSDRAYTTLNNSNYSKANDQLNLINLVEDLRAKQ